MPDTIDDFIQEAEKAIAHVDRWADQVRPTATADHICYKCSSAHEFQGLRELFESNSMFIYQSIISLRRIAVVKFLCPIPTRLGDIWYLELSDQKPDGSQRSGFDHVEIFPKTGTMEDLVRELERRGVRGEKIVRPHHATFDVPIEGSLSVKIEQEPLLQKIVATEMGVSA